MFDGQGRDAEKHTVALNVSSGQTANWPYELAQKVNAASRAIRIGVLKSQQRAVSIVPVKDATANRVYLNDGYPGYGFAIDLNKGDGGVATPPAANSWKEGGKYAAGQVVSYQAAHTAACRPIPPGPAPAGRRLPSPRCGKPSDPAFPMKTPLYRAAFFIAAAAPARSQRACPWLRCARIAPPHADQP